MAAPTPLSGAASQKPVPGDLEPFGESVLWKMQSLYFEENGIDAWKNGEVPHYVTSNPLIANACARMAWAFMVDCGAGRSTEDPVTILEIGGGSGTFAFHFIRRLVEFCRQRNLAPSSVFRYVLSDIAEANIESWLRHPQLSAWMEAGLLDIGRFDITTDKQIDLRVSGRRLEAGALERPLAVIANYLFDSIPQDLFYIAEGIVRPVDRLADAVCRYDYAPPESSPYEDESSLSSLLAYYASELRHSHVLIPAQGWRGLQTLNGWSSSEMLLLAVDKGTSSVAGLDGQSPPEIARHGSVSLPVNIHALGWLSEFSLGISFLPDDEHPVVGVFATIKPARPAGYPLFAQAFQEHANELRPYDFYRVSANVRVEASRMALEDILAHIRLSRYDSHQFAFYLPTITATCYRTGRTLD